MSGSFAWFDEFSDWQPEGPEESARSHVPYQIGTRDREGWRTFQTPGDVCLGCSDPERGWWVAVSECAPALAAFEAEERQLREWDEEVIRALFP